MPLPPGVETVTVSAGDPLTLPDGTAMIGRLLFTAPDLAAIPGQDTIVGGTVEAPLIAGEFTATLVATDATGMNPSGWTYRVEAVLSNAPGWIRHISLPKASPTVVLADVLVPDPVAGTYTTLVDPATVLGGVAVTGPASAGLVLTADSSAAASWQTPSGGGGGGTTIRTTDARVTAGDVVLGAAGSWTIVTSGATQLAASITAAVGDRIQACPSFMRAGGGAFLDLAILASGAISRYMGTDSSTPLLEGHPSYYPQAASFPGVPGAMQIVVGAGEVDGSGKATIALVYQGTGGETVYASATYPFYLLLTNLGPEPA